MPNPQPGGPSLRIFDPRRQGAPAIPHALGTHLVAFYDTHELRWAYSYPPVTTRRPLKIFNSNTDCTYRIKYPELKT
jgi:hypothetical protein